MLRRLSRSDAIDGLSFGLVQTFVFAFLGPPVGGAAFSIAMPIVSALIDGSWPTWSNIAAWLLLVLVSPVLSYVVGLAPAFVAGLCMAVAALAIRRLSWLLELSAPVGAASAAAWMAFVIGDREGVTIVAFAGGFSALVCTRVCWPLRAVFLRPRPPL